MVGVRVQASLSAHPLLMSVSFSPCPLASACSYIHISPGAAFVAQAAGLADRDLLDVRYEGEVPGVLPYFLGVDEKEKALVLAIRGA